MDFRAFGLDRGSSGGGIDGHAGRLPPHLAQLDPSLWYGLIFFVLLVLGGAALEHVGRLQAPWARVVTLVVKPVRISERAAAGSNDREPPAKPVWAEELR